MNRRRFLSGAAAALAGAATRRSWGAAPAAVSRRGAPNILFIVADDLGYSDLGCFGSEIQTPHLDRLAGEGARVTQFYNCAVCVPTRGALLTGRYPHQVGCGEEWGPLRAGVPTLAEGLRAAGYQTSLSGKWHMGNKPGLFPRERGFDRFFGPLGGTADYFAARGSTLYEDDRPYEGPKESFYLTDAITDHAIGCIDAALSARRSFFSMVTYTAPHFPLHARAPDIARYRGKYREGWDVLRARRREQMRKIGVIDPRWPGSPRSELSPDLAWDRLSEKEKDLEDLRMAVYAAQVDRMDFGVGRIVNRLRRQGALDHTMVVFMSDNGPCSATLIATPGGQRAAGIPPGGKESKEAYGLPWASVSGTPFRLYKSWVHEGGISTPFIVRYPGLGARTGSIQHWTGHAIDLLPTFLDAAGAPPLAGGPFAQAREGVSLIPAFTATPPARPYPLCWHQWGGAAVRDGDWKLVRQGATAATNRLTRYGYHPAAIEARWELYHIPEDRSELNDQAKARPEMVARLERGYDDWVKRTNLDPAKVRTDM